MPYPTPIANKIPIPPSMGVSGGGGGPHGGAPQGGTCAIISLENKTSVINNTNVMYFFNINFPFLQSS